MKKKKITYLLTSKKFLLATIAFVFLIFNSKISIAQGAPEPGCPFTAAVSQTPSLCCCNGTVTIAVTSNFVAPLQYKIFKLSDGEPTNFTSTNSNPVTIEGLCSGTYKVIVKDGNNCSEAWIQSITVQGNSKCLEVGIENECFWEVQGCNGSWTIDGSIISEGTPNYDRCWHKGETILSTSNRLVATEAGTYTYRVTDANGCVSSASVYLGEVEIIKTITNADCHNPKGKIDIIIKGGVLDCDPCPSPVFATELFRIDESTGEKLDWDANDLPVLAENYNNTTYPPTTQWNGAKLFFSYVNRDFDITNLAPGKYRIVVKGEHCDIPFDFEIKMKKIEISSVVTQSNCTDPCSGTISVTATGGEGPYIYNWRKDGQPFTGTGANTATISSLCEGDYTVEVMGSDGCATTSETFTINPILDENTIVLTQSCEPTNNPNRVKITPVPISTGTPPYTYLWTPLGLNTSYFNAVSGQSVSVTITDANGCTATLSAVAKYCPPGGTPPGGDVTSQIFPNPTLGQFTTRVVVTDSPHEVDIKVTDNMSNVIYHENKGVLQPGTHDFPIDISSSPAGTYHVIVDWGNISINLVKQ